MIVANCMYAIIKHIFIIIFLFSISAIQRECCEKSYFTNTQKMNHSQVIVLLKQEMNHLILMLIQVSFLLIVISRNL